MALLEVQDLTRYFSLDPGILSRLIGRHRKGVIKAVDSVTFRMEPGEILGIAGESGCGKSTTCMMIARLLPPTGGTIRYKGKEIQGLAGEALRAYRKEVQIIFQDPYESLNPRFTVFDTVAEPLRALSREKKKETEARVCAILEKVGLKPEEYRERFPHQMSGGERQRVGIAAALVLRPELVIADEPLSMLDVSIRAGILDLLLSLSRQMRFSCIYVSHDLSILSNVSERLMIMYLGKIMELAATRELIEKPAHPYSRALISAVPVPDPAYRRPVPNIRGDVSRPVDPPPGCRFERRCPESIPACRLEDPPLREISKGHWAACHRT